MRLRALICALALLALAGCGTAQPQTTTTAGDDLTIYTALPLHGAQQARAHDVLYGERLALTAAGGAVGPYRVTLRPLSDATVKKGWEPGATLDAARAATKDPSTIAYLGDVGAAATALSLPLTNAQDLLQVSPAATYDGFVGGDGSAPGEPQKYQPTGRANFGRIAPSDAVQARAIADAMLQQRCNRVALLRAPDAFDASLAALVETAAGHRGLRVVLDEQVRGEDADSHARIADKVLQAGADCAFFAGEPSDAPGRLVGALGTADPQLHIFAPLGLADDAVARTMAASPADVTVIGPPPPSAQLWRDFEHAYGRPPGLWAAYGYEAMRRTLSAIEAAGGRGNDRRAVVAAYMARPQPMPRLALWQPGPDGLRLDHLLAPT